TSYLPWEAIIDISPEYRDGPYINVLGSTNAPWERQQVHKIWKQDRLPPAPAVIIPGKFLDVDPAVTYAVLRLYHANPSSRQELASSAAVDRIRVGIDTHSW